MFSWGSMGSQKRPKVGPGIESSVGSAPVDPLAGNLGILHSGSAVIILPSHFFLWCVRRSIEADIVGC